MAHRWTIACWVLAAVLVVPAVIFCAQCLAALLPRRRGSKVARPRPTVAVITPAHNEQELLGTTLTALRQQLAASDIMLVVADNCDDRTADIARQHGAEVAERHNADLRGKGYALSHGLSALADRRFDVLVILDADCELSPGSLEALACQVSETGKPAQAIYLMESCENPTARDRVSTWAFMVKNLVRPLGLARFGLPVPLTGTGMAMPRSAMTNVSLASGNLVEDMQLGLDMALAGHAPLLCPAARVTGRLPRDTGAALVQRRRWEHGHLRTLVTQVPKLLWKGLTRGRPAAWAMAMDLIVPPLSLLLVLLIVCAALTGVIAVTTGASTKPALLLDASVIAVLGSVFVAWLKFGRETLPATALPAVASYVVWKLPMYIMFFLRPEKKWVRTEREVTAADAEPVKTAV